MRQLRAAIVTLLFVGPLLAACGAPPPAAQQQFPPLHYEYLTKLRLDVARIDIDDNWAPTGDGRHVEFLSPVPPVDALRQMARDRLAPGGSSNRAVFTIENASIVELPPNYEANLAVRLDLLDDNGNRLRGIEARVTDAQPITGGDPDTVRSDLYRLTRQAMTDMNVELEYQLRHHLAADLQTTSPMAPPPPPVSAQDLGPPGSPPPPPAPADQPQSLQPPLPPADQPESLQPPSPPDQPAPDQPAPD